MKNKYSVLNTNTKILFIKKKKIIEKTFQLNIREMNKKNVQKKILKIIRSYYKQIKVSGILIPKIFSLKIKSNKIVCRMEYKGKNLIEAKTNFTNKENFIINLKKIFFILKKAKIKKINIDPHIKNFVLSNDSKMYYVDIFPPYVKKYEKLRSKFYKTYDEKLICNINFSFFYPKNLFYHFIADLIKFNNKYKKRLNLIYKILIDNHLITSSKYFLIKKYKKIIEIEKLRIRKKYYLA